LFNFEIEVAFEVEIYLDYTSPFTILPISIIFAHRLLGTS